MSEPEILKLTETFAGLNGLIATAAASRPAAVIARAQALLTALRLAPAIPELPETSHGGWWASREEDAVSSVTQVLCWRESDDTLLKGAWSGGALTEVVLLAGGRF